MPLTEADELIHPASDDWLWRESAYFNFHDILGRVAGMTTVGVRPNQNRVEGLMGVSLNHRQVLMYGVRGSVDPDGGGLHGIEGIHYEMIEPFKKWRVRGQADFVPRRASDGASLGPPVPVDLDFVFEAMAPVYEFSSKALAPFIGQSQHYEQNGWVEGRAIVDGQTFDLQGFGNRDRSWGVRDWVKTEHWFMVYAFFGPHLTINAGLAVTQDDAIEIGYLYDQRANAPVTRFQIELETGPDDGLPRAAQVEVGTPDGRSFTLDIQVNSIIPIFKDQGEGGIRWYECLSYITCGQHTGCGTLEVVKTLRRSFQGGR